MVHGNGNVHFVAGVARPSGNGNDLRPKHGYHGYAMVESENECETTRSNAHVRLGAREVVSGSGRDPLHTARNANGNVNGLVATAANVSAVKGRAERREASVSVSVPRSANGHGHPRREKD